MTRGRLYMNLFSGGDAYIFRDGKAAKSHRKRAITRSADATTTRTAPRLSSVGKKP